MTVRGTIALAAVLSVLVAYLALTGERSPTPTPGPAALLAEPERAVARLELDYGGLRQVIRRRADEWTAADDHPIDARPVADVLHTLATLRPLDVVDAAPADPAVYGFGPDAPRLRLVGNDDRLLLELELGASSPAGTALYVRRNARPEVLLVGSLLRWELEKLRAAVRQP